MHERGLISGPLLGQLQQLQANTSIIPTHASSAGAISGPYRRREQPGFPARYRYAPTNGAEDSEKVPPPFLGLPSKATPEGPRCNCAKPARPLNQGCCVKPTYISLSKHQPEGRVCSGKGRRALADEPVPVPSPAPFYCKSLRINMVKQLKIAFNYLSSTSIMQFSQGTLILPILLCRSLLPMSPESFSFSLPSIASPPSPLFPLEWTFSGSCDYAEPLEAALPGLQGNTASLQVQH